MTSIAIKHKTGLRDKMAQVMQNGINAVKKLFSLEEVEVTFTKVGDTTRYSYTKVQHKHAA